MLREESLYKSCKELYSDSETLSKNSHIKITCLSAVLTLISAFVFLRLSFHKSILYISLILLIIFFTATVFFIIKFRIFKSVKVRRSLRGNTVGNMDYPAAKYEKTVTERITQRIKTQTEKGGTVTCRFQHLDSPQSTTDHDNTAVINPDRFEITKNIIVIHSDPGKIK